MLKIKVPNLFGNSNSFTDIIRKYDPVSNIAKDMNQFMKKIDIMENIKNTDKNTDENRPKSKAELIDLLIDNIIDKK
jgi:hypothetical protein